MQENIGVFSDTHALYDGSHGGLPSPTYHLPLVTRLNQRGISFNINMGDCIQINTGQPGWDQFNDITAPLQNGNYYPMLGNHDDLPGFLGFFNAVGGPVSEYGDYNYHRVIGTQFLFVFLDVHTKTFNYGPLSNWLDAILTQYAGQAFKFVCFHMPPYTTGGRGSNTAARDALCPVMQAHGVDICFTGHINVTYERYLINDIHYIVSAMAGAPQSLNQRDVAELSPLRQELYEGSNYMELTLTSTVTQLKAVVKTFNIPYWNEIDAVTIDKSDTLPDPPDPPGTKKDPAQE